MKPRGRRTAIAAAVLGLATIATAAIVLRGRIQEEWYIGSLQHHSPESQRTALKWLMEQGGEASLPAILDYCCSLDPEAAVWRKNGLGRRWMDRVLAMRAAVEITTRLGPERTNAVVENLLAQKKISARGMVSLARDVVRDRLIRITAMRVSDPGPELVDLAIRRLRESLGDPDPLVRAGAALGLAEAGERARSALPALEPLKNDSDPEVREAAAQAIERLSAIPGAGDSER